MKKFLGYKLAILLTCIFILTTACSSGNLKAVNSSTTNEVESGTQGVHSQNPFEANEHNVVVLGSISHRASNLRIDETGGIQPFQYDGSELKIDYQVSASGKAKNVGFLLFINGQPQPYKFNSAEVPYEYMHIFDLKEDNQDTTFTFVFTPVTGKKGQTLPIRFVSIYNPAFSPDMKGTSSYGGYQTTLEAEGKIFFNKDVVALDVSSNLQQKELRNVWQSTELVTEELLERYSGIDKVGMDMLDQKVYSELYVNGAMQQDYLQVNDSGTLHVTFKLFGHPGVHYRNTFYLNHEALTSLEGTSFETILTKGNVEMLGAEISLEKLDDFSTFYVVSVPVNAEDFPNDVIILEKSPSLLLYKGKE
ncbi:hypothetical protein [Paenibacillus etheri]|uniref:Beta-glucanase/beta-glucan synthetase n=1 Tax=Paenibacillus etheri TaxID=1306852 RepID=A0A0W1B438_9BACL|nr:hypothetical protein [Paenibacillus etheri]KTD88332.1 beta-glucanase/beta-glucan synthetase [Paenibacillus etheri]